MRVMLATVITLLHFSDYHSHAVPSYSEDRADQGGIARAIGYMKGQQGALIFSGGDMMNRGAPAWSDEYKCAEWSWFNGVVDAMALGNHDADYGQDELVRCRKSVTYPILSANTPGFEPYAVFQRQGVRIGAFATAGPDIETARQTVRALREKEHVDVVVYIGHEHREDDERLARAVQGIDLIFGTHSHIKQALTKIDGTQTYFISPFQYLTYVSRVQLTIGDHRVTKARGELVRIDKRIREDQSVAKRVRTMQKALEQQHPDLFRPIGRLQHALTQDELGQRTVEVMAAATDADAALSTTSSFRQPLPSGTLTEELLRNAMPYDNEIVLCTMSGAQLQRVLAFAESKRGTDAFAYVARPASIESDKSYKVAAADFLANGPYREVFDCEKTKSGKRVREEVRRRLTASP
ncbi:MAG TPA: 5'-nucleotidase C-terminal domain-containing protein [Thermoanaerobaculia bacterium]|jgi:5'-nucleotidase|nr:5'-nucleotidase C-terminal domain-containing protein [Thermoanaerobaculia bacterium]